MNNPHLSLLNKEQQEAVLATEGPLLVVAGAGTGKTKMLTHRILHLISQGVSPSSLLAITFTNKAAEEMRERILPFLGQDDLSPLLVTFHALGLRILREEHKTLSVNRYFNILDTQDKVSLIKQAMDYHSIDPKEWEPKKISGVISRAKSDGIKVSEYMAENNPLRVITKMVWERYEYLKKQEESFDFDDLLLETFLLLSQNPEILKKYQQRWRYIHVDEYQDTNTIQYKIVKLLAQAHNNICVVGDSDQNIYSWRGADMSNILHFEKDFPGAKVIILEKNYRSSKIILQAAHDVISKNVERIEKKLETDNPEGDKIVVFEAFSSQEEADFVARTTNKLIQDGVAPGDIAVLFRTNFQSRILEEFFLSYSIPYTVVGIKFFERKEVKDILSYLKFSLNAQSLSDLKRIINEPKRGIGKVSIARIFAGQSEQLTAKAKESYEGFLSLVNEITLFSKEHLLSETLKFIIQKSGLEKKFLKEGEDGQERLDNLKELVSYATKYDDQENSFEAFFEETALFSGENESKEKGEESLVRLMTIHASKGLEFSYVFITGLEQGLFPSTRDEVKTSYEEEEERRLCYVAITRAKKQLYLSFARTRMIYGQERINEPSEFLKDISEEFLEHADSQDGEEITHYLEW
ncbi:MAG: UvrD-helicase domain-containing protein [Candidatus Pacebacteria bacterium]|nr:UvrD-helicase domain-containing protein [Candidatus Paceibacterota bacterium]